MLAQTVEAADAAARSFDEITRQAPLVAAVLLVVGGFLWYIWKRDQRAEEHMKAMSDTCHGRWADSDKDRREMFDQQRAAHDRSIEVNNKVVEAFGRTMAVVEKIEKKIDNEVSKRGPITIAAVVIICGSDMWANRLTGQMATAQLNAAEARLAKEMLEISRQWSDRASQFEANIDATARQSVEMSMRQDSTLKDIARIMAEHQQLGGHGEMDARMRIVEQMLRIPFHQQQAHQQQQQVLAHGSP